MFSNASSFSKDISLPERYLRLTDRIQKKYDVHLRPVNMKKLDADVKTLLFIANESTMNNWGFSPVTEEEASQLADSLKLIADPDIIFLAEMNEKMIGYMITLPDINSLIKNSGGRLFPKALFNLLFKQHSVRDYRIWALGIIPEFQRKGIDTLFYRELCETLVAKKAAKVEANYILEDNMVMNNPILKLGLKECKRYRVFAKEFSE